MRIGTREVEYRPIPDAVVRWEVVIASSKSLPRAAAAALGLSCPGLVAARYEGNAFEYGAKAFNELVASGLSEGDVFAASMEAFAAVSGKVNAMPTEAEVAEVEGFTEGAAP